MRMREKRADQKMDARSKLPSLTASGAIGKHVGPSHGTEQTTKLPALSGSSRRTPIKQDKDSHDILKVKPKPRSRSAAATPPAGAESRLSKSEYSTAAKLRGDRHINAVKSGLKSAEGNSGQYGGQQASSEEKAGGWGGEGGGAKGKRETLQKFKTLANKVKNQIVWTKGLQRAEEHMKMYAVPGQEGLQGETLTFNVNAFKPEIQSWEGLSPKAKAILVKPSWLRTDNELKFLHRFTIRLKCFDRYPMYVRKELARVLCYESFDKGRVVIRQGDIGFNFYFILSGSVLIEMEEKDHRTGKNLNMIVGELSSGAAFGELALMHDDRRRATIVCNEYSEFLKVDKPDFDEVLKKNHEREWAERMEYFKEHPLFEGWTPPNLHYAVESSQTVEYLPNTVILKDLEVPSESIFFIVKGTCKVVQKVYFWEQVETGYPKYAQKSVKLPPLSIGIRNQNETGQGDVVRQVKKWWVLRVLQPGNYFGVGEGDRGVSVISHEKAEVLLVNKMVFMRCERGKCLARMRTETAKLYPSRKTALESYKETKRWKEYKKQVVMDAVNSHKSSALWSPFFGAS